MNPLDQAVLLTQRDFLMGTANGPRGKASEWLKTARGAVRLLPGETADDIRMDYYADKYGLPLVLHARLSRYEYPAGGMRQGCWRRQASCQIRFDRTLAGG